MVRCFIKHKLVSMQPDKWLACHHFSFDFGVLGLAIALMNHKETHFKRILCVMIASFVSYKSIERCFVDSSLERQHALDILRQSIQRAYQKPQVKVFCCVYNERVVVKLGSYKTELKPIWQPIIEQSSVQTIKNALHVKEWDFIEHDIFLDSVWPKFKNTLIKFKDLDNWQQMNNTSLGETTQQEASYLYNMPILENISRTQHKDLDILSRQLQKDAFDAFQKDRFDCFDDNKQRVSFLEDWLKKQGIKNTTLDFSCISP